MAILGQDGLSSRDEKRHFTHSVEVPMHDMWIGLLAARKKQTGLIKEPLVLYRRHGANVSLLLPKQVSTKIKLACEFIKKLYISV